MHSGQDPVPQPPAPVARGAPGDPGSAATPADGRVRQTYAQRAGVEGTLSQGVRAFGLRQARYRGLAKTHLQDVAMAAAINAGRLVNWLNDRTYAVVE